MKILFGLLFCPFYVPFKLMQFFLGGGKPAKAQRVRRPAVQAPPRGDPRPVWERPVQRTPGQVPLAPQPVPAHKVTYRGFGGGA